MKARRTAGGPDRAITVLLEDPRLDYPYAGGAFSELDRSDVARLKEALAAIPGYRFELLDRHDGLAAELAARRPWFVFNLCDTGLRNRESLECHIPALLEILDIPYSGAGPEGLVLCRDKSLVRALAAELGVPVPAERYLDPRDDDPRLDGFPYPAIFKPNLDDGSRMITAASVVADPRAAADCLRRLRAELPNRPWLLQEFLPGREYSVGLVGNPESGFQQLPINEVDYDRLDPELPRILAFQFKTDPQSRYWRQLRYRPAELTPAAAAELTGHARRLFARLGCRDYARIDFRADGDGRIKLLEVNPNPAWVWKGGLHSMAIAADYAYPEFLAMLLEAALARTGAGAGRPRFWRPASPASPS